MGDGAAVDRRVRRTKLAIRTALVALIEEQGFEAVSVSDIASRANINRGTFYLHYQDKFELLEKTVDGVIADLEQIFWRAKSLSFADFIRTDQPVPITVEIFEYIKANEALMRVVFGLAEGVAFQTKLRAMVENTIKLGFLAGLQIEHFRVPREYLLSYLLHAHLGVAQTWLNTGCKEPPREMARILSRLTLDGPVRTAGFDSSGS